jgi:transposase-like protein
LLGHGSSEREAELVTLLKEVQDAFSVPIRGVISDGQKSIRNAVAAAFPDIPHQLCHFHYLREAAKPVYEADRHAKKELKKQVRGIRPIERACRASGE